MPLVNLDSILGWKSWGGCWVYNYERHSWDNRSLNADWIFDDGGLLLIFLSIMLLWFCRRISLFLEDVCWRIHWWIFMFATFFCRTVWKYAFVCLYIQREKPNMKNGRACRFHYTILKKSLYVEKNHNQLRKINRKQQRWWGVRLGWGEPLVCRGSHGYVPGTWISSVPVQKIFFNVELMTIQCQAQRRMTCFHIILVVAWGWGKYGQVDSWIDIET